jgi:hypothetical protein
VGSNLMTDVLRRHEGTDTQIGKTM